ncbi:MAG: N-acetylmuramoyl-L-alanine amidase [Polyangia bacterium]
MPLVGDSLPYAGVRYSGSVWKPAPSSNFTVGRSAAIDLLVIHTCSGGYSGCVGWLQTPYPTNPYKTSAHYVVKEDGTEIAALVDESNTAHHVGASWEGRPTNPRSVGIEHGGFSYQGTNKWTEGQVSASAKLSCDVVKRNRIPRDRNHIIGHYQPDPVNRADDPGRDFPWADYMNRISRCVGGSTAIVVDSNQANNDASGKIDTPSSSWTSSTNVAGYYGSGYYVAPTAAVSDAVYFSFYLTEAANREVFAWWTAASDRSTETPFVIFDAAGNKLATVKKNQQDNGSQWVSLGRYNFTVGWNQVAISRWATAGSVVVADAIKVE